MVDKQLPYTADATAAPLSALGGAEPWPFDFTLFFPGTVLNASGTLSGSLHRPALRAAFGAGTADTREVERLLGVPLPPVGAAAIAGELDVAPGTAALRSINGVIGATRHFGRPCPRYERRAPEAHRPAGDPRARLALVPRPRTPAAPRRRSRRLPKRSASSNGPTST